MKKGKYLIDTEKYIVRKKFRTDTISCWLKVRGYDLSICTLRIDIFGHNLQLVHGDPREFNKYMKEKFQFDDGRGHGETAAMYTFVTRNGIRYKFLCCQILDFKAEDYGTLAHELHHFVHIELKDRGVNHGDDSEEVFAYYQGHVMELACRAFNELRKHSLNKLKKKRLSGTQRAPI